MPPSKDILRQLDNVDWDFSGYVPNGRSLGIHNIHWYPAPFPPAVAGTLIDILGGRSTTFLDPFCGSSVAPLEAWFRGKKAFGIDNNRFAIQMAEAKTQLIREGTVEVAKQLLDEYLTFRRKSIASWGRMLPATICERAQIHTEIARWFIQSVLAEIAILKVWISYEGKLASLWRDVLTITLSSLLHGRYSIVRDYHYTYIVDNSRVKEEAREMIDVPGIFGNKLLANFIQGQLAREQLLRINSDLRIITTPRFFNDRAQNIEHIIDDKIDIVITSPPYFGMNDYVRSQYLTWLLFQWEGYDEDLSTESGSRRRRTSKTSLDSYFDDMYRAFQGIYRILDRKGYLALVLGRSETKLAKEVDPLLRLATQLEEIGFVRLWAGKRRVRFRKINNQPFRTEVIWVLQS